MKTLFCSMMLMTSIPAAVAQTEIRRAGAHVHSVAAAQLALEDGRVDLMLQIPGANLVGFEHPPRVEEQSELLASARARLAAGDWLVFSDGAGCATDISVDMPGFAASGHEHDHSHDHEHSRDHGHAEGHEHHEHHHDHEDDQHGHVHQDHEHDGHDHAEFHLTVTADCERTPDWLEVRLFDGWPDNRSIQLDAISATQQWRAELTAEQTRVALR